MKNYSSLLYKKLKTEVTKTLDDDRFYEYFMNVLESGVRFYGQKNEIIIKKIDPEWVNALENTIPALDTIVNKPRKFIERDEVIVPIELARKVGADSVKHLATHTQFISQVDEDGNVVPNKILNIFSEESYNLYENRFIITLINRASSFIDKRYDMLLKMAGDEFQSVLKLDSSFSDNGETVDYNLVFKLHQGQEYLNTKNDSLEILKKIEHIRLMFNSFKKSEFYQSLAGCTPVKSPIKRTNLMTKNHDFKRCYDLWYFLEKYTHPGYSVEKQQYDGVFDKEYVDELNSLVLFNYLIIKNNLEGERNKPADAENHIKKSEIKPKFIKNIIEEVVTEYDITEKELKQIFEDEISRAYNAKKNREEEILLAIINALGAEVDINIAENREEKILSLLKKALNAELKKRDAEERDPEENLLEEAILKYPPVSEEKKREDVILEALKRFLKGEEAEE